MNEVTDPGRFYLIELVEYGCRTSLLEVSGVGEVDAAERVDSFDPDVIPVEGLVVVESVFEATDSEIMSIEPVG